MERHEMALASLFMVALVFLAGCASQLQPKACTMEAKVCPDGSSVGRNGSRNCEFDPCPADFGTLRGKVSIGPLCPVEPCPTQPNYTAIYGKRKVIIYDSVTRAKKYELPLNESGEFYGVLKAGAYVADVTDANGNELGLNMETRPRMGTTTPRQIEIMAGQDTILNIGIDTGIR